MSPGEDAAADRRATIATAIAAHRREGTRSPVTFAAGGEETAPTVTYADREIVVTVEGDERDRLVELLEEFHVFKIAQPATRKAPDKEVHLSALADAKHAADFIDEVFLTVYEQPREYQLVVEEP